MASGFKKNSNRPVSYTHLDVYKRQAWAIYMFMFIRKKERTFMDYALAAIFLKLVIIDIQI